MEDEYIDIRDTERALTRLIERFKHDTTVIPENRELVLSFVRDARIGKTYSGTRRRKVGPAALTGYINQLRHYIAFFKKPLNTAVMTDIEEFVEALESDQIRSLAVRFRGVGRSRERCSISPRYKADIKLTVRKFYRWLAGTKEYPPLVDWIDTFVKDKPLPALTPDQIQRLLDRSASIRQKAIVQILFDGGLRIGELLNIRLYHVKLHRYEHSSCFVLRIPYSKTMPRVVALPLEQSTRLVRLWLEEHPARPKISEDGTLEANNQREQLFPMSDHGVRETVRLLGKKALNERVYPHLLRHTSATYWANKLPYFQFCKRFGWTMTSDMPKKYIDRAGVDEIGAMKEYTTIKPAQPLVQHTSR